MTATVPAASPPGIPPGCICAYTWHPAHDGRVIRNSPVLSCPADHFAADWEAGL